MSTLSFTVGIARCGKSTWVKEFKKQHPETVVLSGDDFRRAIYDRRFQLVGEPLVRATLLTSARALLIGGNNVLIEDTNTSIGSIQEILDLDINAKAFFFTTDHQECIRRAHETKQPDLEKSIYRMENNLQKTLRALEDGSLVIHNIEEVKTC